MSIKKKTIYILLTFVVLTLPISWMLISKPYHYHSLTKSIITSLNNKINEICITQNTLKSVRIERVLHLFGNDEMVIYLRYTNNIENSVDLNLTNSGKGFIVFQKHDLCENKSTQDSYLLFNLKKGDLELFESIAEIYNLYDRSGIIDIDTITWHPLIIFICFFYVIIVGLIIFIVAIIKSK